MRRVLCWIGGGTVAFAAMIALWFAMAGFLLPWDDEPGESIAIVLLAGDVLRAPRAAELYHAGYAPRVLISRPVHRVEPVLAEAGVPQPRHEETLRRILLHRGVPPEAIEYFGDGHISTVEEVEALRAHLDGDEGRLLIVTSPSHVLRAGMVLGDLMPEREILVCASNAPPLESAWWTDRDQAVNVVMETAKIVFYLVGGAYRSPAAARSAGAAP